MSKGWTAERRAQQAQRIQQWRPWEKSTGPRTQKGKAASSQNAITHGLTCAEGIEARKRFNAVMRQARAVLDQIK